MTLSEGRPRGWRRRRQRETVEALAEQIAVLRDENQRLAREQCRPSSMARITSEIRSVTASLVDGVTGADAEDRSGGSCDGDRELDTGFARALEVEMMRRGLVEVCELLQTMAAQLAESLTRGLPLHEIDRRVRDRPVLVDRRRRRDDPGRTASEAPSSGECDSPQLVPVDGGGVDGAPARSGSPARDLVVVDADGTGPAPAPADGTFG